MELYKGSAQQRAFYLEYLIGFILSTVFIGLIYITYIYLKALFTKYEITSEVISLRTGILFQKTENLNLYRVKDITYKQNIFDMIFNQAKIIIVSSDKTNPILVLKGVPNHDLLFKRLSKAIEDERRKYGVNLIDY